MPLIKCPDCEKMVSDRVESCPFCGCPAQFFVRAGENVERSLNAEQTGAINKPERKEGMTSDNNREIAEGDKLFAEFFFLGRTISYYKKEEIFIKAMKLHNKAAAIGERKLRKKYAEIKNMDKVWDDIIPQANHMINEVIKEDLNWLYQAGIIMSENQFIQKYKIDMTVYIQPIIDAYDQVIEAANDLRTARRIERNSRSQWQGGGFGLKGAIKGAITAGALNTITGAGRAIGDTMVNSSDNSKIRDAKQKIYNDESYQEKIFDGFRMCMAKADIGFAEELAEKGITHRVKVDFVEAAQAFVAAAKYEKNKSLLAQKAIDSILIYPFDKMFYKPLLGEAIMNEDEDIDRVIDFMDFWNMNEDFPEIFDDVRKKKLVNAYLNQHPEIKTIDFEQYSSATYVKVRDAKLELEKVVGNEKLPNLVDICLNIMSYFEKCLDEEHTLDSIEVLRSLKEDDPAEIFVKKMHDEKAILPGLLKDVWLSGDADSIPEKKIKNKWGIPNTDVILMYQNKAILGTLLGGIGFVLTQDALYDLQSKSFIIVREITAIDFDNKGFIFITDGRKKITIDVSDEKPAAKTFLYMCLREYVHRYADFTREKQHERAVYNTVEKIQAIVSEYSKNNSVTDSDELLRDFLTRYGIKLKTEIATMFCPYCGKQINAEAKYCNFCGEENTYRGVRK